MMSWIANIINHFHVSWTKAKINLPSLQHMCLLPHVNHVCDTDATAIYSLFQTCYTITYFHDMTAILVDYPPWDKYTLKIQIHFWDMNVKLW